MFDFPPPSVPFLSSQGYLDTKRDRMAHMMKEEEPLDGQFCFWDHDGEPRVPSISDAATAGGMGVPKDLKVSPNGRVTLEETA